MEHHPDRLYYTTSLFLLQMLGKADCIRQWCLVKRLSSRKNCFGGGMQTVERLDMLRERQWAERSPVLQVYILRNLRG